MTIDNTRDPNANAEGVFKRELDVSTDDARFNGDVLGETDETVTPETAEIRANIEQTRTEMSGTIEAIQDKLNPQHIAEQVKEQVKEQFQETTHAVREATIGKAEAMVRNVSDTATEVRYTLVDTIRQNPIPAALVGLGLGWLYMNSRNTPSRSYNRYDDRGYRGQAPSYANEYRYVNSYDEGRYNEQYYAGGQQGQRGVTNTLHNAQDRVSSTINDVQDTAGNIANKAQQTAGDIADKAQQTAGDIANKAQRQAYRVEDYVERTLQENPLGVAAFALALGMGVGLAMPQTERENELMGEARDTLVERAQSVAQDTIGKVQRVAEEVVDQAGSTVKEQAKQQGIVS